MIVKMTNERWAELKAARKWTTRQESEISDELDRARRIEAMTYPTLVQRLREKDATIKALADALDGLLREEPNIYEGRLEASLYVTVDALDAAREALRLTGRLP